jgi:hypothetical protein
VRVAGQATLPNLEIGEGACKVLSDLLGAGVVLAEYYATSRVAWRARPRPAFEVQLSAAHACALRVQNGCPSTDVRREVLLDHLPANKAESSVVPNAHTVRHELAHADDFPLDISGPAQGPHAPMSSRMHPQLGNVPRRRKYDTRPPEISSTPSTK